MVYNVLKKPILSEKTEILKGQNVYVFEVPSFVNKIMIKEAFFKIYKVAPVKVHTLNVYFKSKRNRYGVGYKPRKKKAFVYLSKRDKVDIFES